MKTTKPQAILLFYERLVRTGRITKTDFLNEVIISETTFKRYVSEIRCFLANYHPDLDLVYHKREDTYCLEQA
jgi:hypothetical protein